MYDSLFVAIFLLKEDKTGQHNLIQWIKIKA